MPSESISDRLAAYGITHEPGSDQRRVVRWSGKSLGMMDAEQASNLLGLLDLVKADRDSMAKAYAGMINVRRLDTAPDLCV